MFHKFFITLLLSFAAFCASFQTYADTVPKPDTISKYLEVLEKKPDDKESLKAVGYHFMTLGNDKETKKYADKLLKIAKKDKDRNYAELHGLILLASVYLSTDYPKALEIYNRALSIAHRTDNHEALLSIYNGLGIYNLFRVQDTTQAIEYFQKALEEAKITNDRRRYAIITSNLAGVYITRNDQTVSHSHKKPMHMPSKTTMLFPSFTPNTISLSSTLSAIQFPRQKDCWQNSTH